MTGRPCRLRATIALCTLALGAPAAAAPQDFDLDPAHTFVHFEVLHFDTSTLRGRIGPIAGEAWLDARLRRPDLLDVDGHPEAYFVAERFRFESGQPAELTGEFTLRGIGTALTLRALRFACIDSPAGRRCGGDFEGQVLRSSFGASFGLPLVADRVRLRVQVEGLARR